MKHRKMCRLHFKRYLRKISMNILYNNEDSEECIVTKGSVLVGLFSAVAGFLFGTAYLFTNKDYRKALPIITLLFIL